MIQCILGGDLCNSQLLFLSHHWTLSWIFGIRTFPLPCSICSYIYSMNKLTVISPVGNVSAILSLCHRLSTHLYRSCIHELASCSFLCKSIHGNFPVVCYCLHLPFTDLLGISELWDCPQRHIMLRSLISRKCNITHMSHIHFYTLHTD